MALHRMGLGAARRDRDRHDRDDEDQEALLGRRSSVTSDGTGGGGGGGPSSSGRGRGRRSDEPFLRRVTSRLSIKSRGDGDDRSTSPAPSIAPDFQPSTATRVVSLDKQHRSTQHYPPNIISNHKFTPFTFLPLTLYHEFSFFFNLYFLLVALSQIIPALRIGFLSTYIVPLVFVLAITLGKEAHDDIARRRRDTEANSEPYEVLAPSESDTTASTNSGAGRLRRLGKKRVGFEDGHEIRTGDGDSLRTIVKKSRDLRVGDILVLRKDQRVPADVVILKSISNDVGDDEDAGSDGVAGEAFIRTDQLDGETDWKLRVAPTLTQTLSASELESLEITAAAPSKEVNNFLGSIKYTTRSAEYDPAIPVDQDQTSSVGLSIDNTAWSNTVLASNSTTIAAIIYTGPETRAALSTSKSRSKTGLLEQEINNLTKILCALTFTLSIVLVALRGFESQPNKPGVTNPDRPEEVVSGAWYIKIMRFLILFSTIIPISLRVNLDMGKSAYAWFIEHDKDIEGTVVRTSTIPEELGRVEYLLSDKTGTLTQNDMELKKVHVGTVSYAGEAMEEVSEFVNQRFAASGGIATATDMPAMQSLVAGTSSSGPATGTRGRREIGSRVRDLVLALALCHNVTPTTDDNTTTYQASSPDEIAIVRWTESVGLRLVHRDRKGMKLQSVATGEVVVRVKILEVFPFTSEGKRMGIVVQFLSGNSDEKGKQKQQEDLLSGDHDLDTLNTSQSDDDDIWFFQKGADTVMTNIVARNDWLDEECGNMAREGLRTLVIGRKRLSSQRYEEFSARHKAASQLLQDREAAVAKVVQDYLEHDLELLGVTGVEDKLQKDVKPSLELLRNAGIKIWMLTGDKVETARCVAVSAKLVARGQYIHTIAKRKLCLYTPVCSGY